MLLSIKSHNFRCWNTVLLLLLATIYLYISYKSYESLNQARTSKDPPTVNLILATLKHQPYGWTKSLSINNLKILPYVADNPAAIYHPAANKGNEAISYLTYLHDFYDTLPDISIFIHGSDSTWHIDGVLQHSTRQALSRLDLEEVRKRGYLNLRTSWENACPVWINTSIQLGDERYDENLREEEPYIRGAIENIFPEKRVPSGLASPCCSQFAVTKERIRRIPKERYKKAIDWLMNTELESKVSGRVWEHLWHWLFLEKDIDCPSEWRALCVWYHICFDDEQDFMAFQEMEIKKYEMWQLQGAMLRNGLQPESSGVVSLTKGTEKIEAVLEPWRLVAIERGKDENFRESVGRDL